MADQTIEIKLILRDEMSRALAPITAELQKIQNLHLDRPTTGMQRFAGATQVVRRELSALSSLALGGIIGGGFIASIVGISKALGDMAQQGLKLHYTAQQLGVKQEWLQNLTDGLSTLGMTSEEAAGSLKSALTSLRDAETFGTESSLFKTLEKGVRGTGIKLWRELRSIMAGPEGAQGALQHLFRRMKDMAPSGQRELLKAMGISSLAVGDLEKILPQLHKRIHLGKEEMLALNAANTNFKISMGNVGTILGSAVMPAVTKITKAFADFLETDAGQKFAAQLRTWSDSVATSISGWILDKGPTGLEANIESFKKAIASLQTNFEEADKVIKALGLSWTPILLGLVATAFLPWLISVHATLALIARNPAMMAILLGTAALYALLPKFQAQADPNIGRQPYTLDDIRRRMEGEEDFWQKAKRRLQEEFPWLFPKEDPKKMSGEGKPETEQERRAAMHEDQLERDALNAELKQLAIGTGHLVDYLGQGAIGGPEGTPGISGFGAGVGGGGGFDTTSVLRKGGMLPAWATPLTAIPRTVRPAQSEGTGFASWYGNRPDLGFIDPGDKGRAGVREEDQGIALGPLQTLKDWFELTNPHTGLTHITQQTDTGPNISTGKLVDIHASQLARMGYSATGGFGGGGVSNTDFPTGRGLWNVKRAFGDFAKEPSGLNYRSNYEGGASSWDEAGFSDITGSLAQRSSSLTGSATVDIDVGGLGQVGRNPDSLFRPQSLDGIIQMQNATQQPHNPLSYQ